MKFPKTLYVKIEDEGKDQYYVADDHLLGLADMGEKTKIAVYTLAEVGEIEGVVNTSRLSLVKK